MEDLSGTTLKGYELRELIGMGGYGVVYRAYQTLVEREVAIKIILPEYANRPYFIRHFEIEAQLIARLEHLHIVPLYDYWRDPDGAYIVMRWLRGGNLSQTLRESPLAPLEAARMLEQIAAALTIAHRNGVIHQDLKSANILLDEDGNAYLSDFGIAKDLMRKTDDDSDDPDNVIRGSPDYVAPEQILNAAIDAATDVYSLGILLFEMLTGMTPFTADDDQETLRRQLYEKVPPLQTHRPDLPESFNIVINRATDKHPRRRYKTALSMAEGFREFVTLHTGQEAAAPVTVDPGVTAQQRPAAKSIDLGALDVLAEPVNPYKGLRAFQEADAADFFGRDALVQRLRERIEESAAEARFLAVVGPSGSGKSSAVKAGLIPLLRKGEVPGSRRWFIQEMTPGAQPVEELAAVLTKVAKDSSAPLVELLNADQDGLRQALGRILPGVGSQLFLVIDQFEEVFTAVEDEAKRAHFLNLLVDALMAEDSQLRLVTTLRADFYDRPLLYSEFGNLMRQRTEVVLPMTPQELRQAIAGPAERVGLALEEGLVEEIVADVSDQPSALPLLQYALTELYMARKGSALTHSAYRESGGVSGALTRRADEILLKMSPENKEVARQLFLRLVTLGDGTEDTRRRVLQSELAAVRGDRETMNRVIDVFGKFRLLAFDREPLTREPTVEIAHEALIRQWRVLREWLDNSRDALRVQRQLASSAGEWVSSERDPSFLAGGARLEQFEALMTSGALGLTQNETDYILASIRLREQNRRRRRMFIATLIAISVVAVIFAGMALFNQQQTERARAELEVAQATTEAERDRADLASHLARSRELAVTALTNRDRLDLALLLSVEALRATDTFQARSTLLALLQSNPRLVNYLHAHSDWVRTLAFSPDGSLLASGGRDGLVVLWDMASNRMIGQPLQGHESWVNGVAFSPDGSLLASGGQDGRVLLWETASGQQIAELSGRSTIVWRVAFSPDGSLLVASGNNGLVSIWDVTTGEIISELQAHSGEVFAVVFGPDGSLLATGGDDDLIHVWSLLANDGEPRIIEGHTNWVRDLAFSPDGSLLAAGDEDGIVRLWDVDSGAGVTEFAHGQAVRDVEFLGAELVSSAGADGRILFWNLALRDPVGGLVSPRGDAVLSVAFDPARELLASGGHNRDIILWTLRANPHLATTLYAPGGQSASPIAELVSDGSQVIFVDMVSETTPNTVRSYSLDGDGATSSEVSMEKPAPRLVLSASFSTDGSLLATSGLDQTIVLHDAATGTIITELTAHRDAVFSLAFSADGSLLASGGNDGRIVLWRHDAGEGWQPLGEPLRGHDVRVLSLSFNADGSLLASGGQDGEIALWRVDGDDVTPIGAPLAAHDSSVLSLAFNADGTLLASGSREGQITLWRVNDDQILQTGAPLIGHLNMVLGLAFSPDGSLLASASRDNSVILWDMREGDDLVRPLGDPLGGHNGAVNRVRFSPDGVYLVSAGDDGLVLRWDVSTDLLMQRACRIANRSLRVDEWRQFLGTEDYRATCPDTG
jgi:WD40 repeat protein